MKYIIALFTLGISVSLYSCAKHPMDEYKTPSSYKLEFDNPVMGAVYNYGDSIHLKGMAINTQSIHGYDLRVREVNDTTVHYAYQAHEHNDTLMISHKWKNTVEGPKNMEAEVILHLDHDGNTGSKKIFFSIQ